MSKIVAMHSYRGGTGKSTTAANLGVLLARRGYRVALVDADLQAPAMDVLFAPGAAEKPRSLIDYLLGLCEIEDAAHEVSDGLYLVPARSGVSKIDEIMAHGYDVGLLREGFDRLIELLGLDVLVVDTHAGISNETATSIGIADELLIVTRADRLDLTGAAESIALANRLNCPRRAVVVNLADGENMPEAMRGDVETVYGARISAIVPYIAEMATLADEQLFVTACPDHPLIDSYHRIIDSLMLEGYSKQPGAGRTFE